MALPEVASREQWLRARLALLGEEKELARRRDALNAARRRLPMVKVEKDYVFDGSGGPADAVFAAGLLSHLPDAEAGLRELARVTRPDGLPAPR